MVLIVYCVPLGLVFTEGVLKVLMQMEVVSNAILTIMEKTVVFVLVSGAFVTIPSLGMVIVLREIVRMVQNFSGPDCLPCCQNGKCKSTTDSDGSCISNVLLPAVAMEPVIILLMALENVFPVILDLRDQIAMLVMIKLIVYTEFVHILLKEIVRNVFQFRP